MPTRRLALEIAVSTVLIGALAQGPAWAGSAPADLDSWARQLANLNRALRAREISVTDWQVRVERLNTSVPLSDLTSYLDVEALTRRFTYASRLADTADPVLPREVIGDHAGWFVRIFGMRRDGAVIPHVHNNMVSAHLVISGAFHARTANRLRDEADAVVLRRTRDGIVRPGDIISMSDQRDNHHWLIAQEDRSMTLDVGVVDVGASWRYGLSANEYGMIFVDADRTPERDGTYVAPVMSFSECAAKYADYRP